MPEDEGKKSGLCPICDAKVDIDAKKCPECRADLTIFGVKTGEEEAHDVKIPEDESLERLLGEIGQKDEKKEHELFEEIMAAVDKTAALPVEEAVSEPPTQETAPSEAAEKETVMFECPLCNTLVGEDAKSCPGCGAIFAAGEEEEAAEPSMEESVPEIAPSVPAVEEPPLIEEEKPLIPEPEVKAPPPEKPKKKFKLGIKRKEGILTRVTEAKPAEAKKDVKSLQRELASCVSEVKPLLANSRKIGINVLEGRKLIDQAIAAGKKRDFEGAITLVKESKKIMENSLNEHIIDSIQSNQSKIVSLSEAGGDVSELENMLAKVQLLLNERKYIEAVELSKKTSGEAQKIESELKAIKEEEEKVEPEVSIEPEEKVEPEVSLEPEMKIEPEVRMEPEEKKEPEVSLEPETKIEPEVSMKPEVSLESKARVEPEVRIEPEEKMGQEEGVSKQVEAIVDLIKSGEEVEVNVKGAKELLTQARMAIKKSEYGKAENLLNEAKEDFLKELPKQLTDIISSSKPVLYKAKMQGVDIKPSINLLKEASMALKLNNYRDAMEAIKRYRNEMTQYME